MTDQPPPPQPNPQPQPPTSSSNSSNSSKGLVGRIFDLSFSDFITPSIIKLLFVLGVIGAGILALVIFISLANAGGSAVVAGFIVFAVYVLIARVVGELNLVLFRIEENTRRRQ